MSSALETIGTLPPTATRTRVSPSQPTTPVVERTTTTPAVRAAAGIMSGICEPTRQQIRDRAYFIYLARNGGPGDATADWSQAERDLREEFRHGTFSGT